MYASWCLPTYELNVQSSMTKETSVFMNCIYSSFNQLINYTRELQTYIYIQYIQHTFNKKKYNWHIIQEYELMFDFIITVVHVVNEALIKHDTCIYKISYC
jgi:hypothetical protein